MAEVTVHLVTLNNSGTDLLERKTCGFHSLPTLLSTDSSPYSYWDTGVTSGNSVPRTVKRNSMPVKVQKTPNASAFLHFSVMRNRGGGVSQYLS